MKILKEVMLVAVGLSLTIALILILNNVFKTGEKTISIASENMDEYNTYLLESDLIMYEGLDVEGSNVVSFIKKNLGEYGSTDISDVYIYVKTNLTENTYINGNYIQDIQAFNNNKYIKPIGKFKCEVIRDANDVIVGVKFVQL